jgi:hypothetical protein
LRWRAGAARRDKDGLITDLIPTSGPARGSYGLRKNAATSSQLATAVLEELLGLGVQRALVGSATVSRFFLEYLLKQSKSVKRLKVVVPVRDFDYILDVLVNVSGIAGTGGQSAAIAICRCAHLSMLRMPPQAMIIPHVLLMFYQLTGCIVTEEQYRAFKKAQAKGGAMTDEQIAEALALFVQELKEVDRYDEFLEVVARSEARAGRKLNLMEQTQRWYSHKGGLECKCTPPPFCFCLFCFRFCFHGSTKSALFAPRLQEKKVRLGPSLPWPERVSCGHDAGPSCSPSTHLPTRPPARLPPTGWLCAIMFSLLTRNTSSAMSEMC